MNANAKSFQCPSGGQRKHKKNSWCLNIFLAKKCPKLKTKHIGLVTSRC
jgi:hypothetical protein